VVIEVSDNGPGISKDEIALIFDRFYQVDKSRSNGTGAGLGLSIAQKILELHNADLSVESLLKKGTTFRVSMPSQMA
jgi:signal transduction histidine kinase